MEKQIIEIQCYSELELNDTSLDFQNFIYQLLDKIKKENKVLKMDLENNNSIKKAIRRDSKELLNLKIIDITSPKKSYLIVKIFDKGEIHQNEGLNIEITKTTMRIKQKSAK